eukprot:jgi/Tetstr1/434336/TSEL_023442.t1
MVKHCRACDRVKASFNQKHDRLKPMPLFGLFYRFSVDSAGPLPTSSEGHKYVIVIMEHFSKWIEPVPVRDLEAPTTAKAFHERVLAHYGAPVEVVTDNGIEYQGAFREQLERHGIQPLDIPPRHPQANGMAERTHGRSASDLGAGGAPGSGMVEVVGIDPPSKWIKLVPVRDLKASTTAKGFHERVLARYGAPVEVVTDNGTKHQGTFREQLERHGIQPVDIPPEHPQAYGMAERIVQVLKVGLRKVVRTLGTGSWHSWMSVIELVYRVIKQAATGYSPYFLLFGRDHVAPDQVRALLEEPVAMDNDSAVINLITQRADMLRAAMPKAFERALQAQHRDVVRYRKVRRGDVQPRRHRFETGHYVYVAQPPLNTLDVRAARTILRSVEILESGSDGNEIQVHMDDCAPCHLSNLVPARPIAREKA